MFGATVGGVGAGDDLAPTSDAMVGDGAGAEGAGGGGVTTATGFGGATGTGATGAGVSCCAASTAGAGWVGGGGVIATFRPASLGLIPCSTVHAIALAATITPAAMPPQAAPDRPAKCFDGGTIVATGI